MPNNVSNFCNQFQSKIDDLINLDAQNQAIFSSQTTFTLNKSQVSMLTEAVFIFAFREYENFIQDLFLMYCMGEETGSQQPVASFLKARDAAHAHALLRSSMPFLEWSNPDVVISRAETYLDNDGFPVKLPCAAHRLALGEMKAIRNHIAHNSKESTVGFKKVVSGYLGTIPLTLPSPGEFLLFQDKKIRKKYKLQVYLELFKNISTALC